MLLLQERVKQQEEERDEYGIQSMPSRTYMVSILCSVVDRTSRLSPLHPHSGPASG